ncbi:MAG: CCA tRNA nucleotidyltransferase [Candidatus Aminicenantales bacterium]
MDENSPSPCPTVEPIVLSRSGHPISRKDIDPDALKIIFRLHRMGFIAYLCGGAVRDLMLGRTPKDFDIATDARPGQIKKRFANVFIIGRRFRLAHVHFHGGKIIEVATFRRDSPPAGETPPNGPVDPSSLYGTPREDASRRDITINALYYNPVTRSVIDFVGGLEDLACRKVRIIGDASDRFIEDPVRVWRVLRHAARLGFAIEEATECAVRVHAPLIAGASGARLFEELNKDLAYETRPVIEALRKYGLLGHILGRIGETYQADPDLFQRLGSLLDAEERARTAGLRLSSEEMYALILWPWANPLFRDDRDMSGVLAEAIMNARVQATLPRALRTDVIQIWIIVDAMIRALRTGRMRWSFARRSHYPAATRVFFLIEQGCLPREGETFESLFRKTFPSASVGLKLKQRRRRRRRPRHNEPA